MTADAITRKICLLNPLCGILCFNPQDRVWEQGSYAQHFFVPDGSVAPDSPDSVPEAHYEHQWHGRADSHHGERIFHGGTNYSDEQYYKKL